MAVPEAAPATGGDIKPICIIDFDNPQVDGIADFEKLLSTVEPQRKLVSISVVGRYRGGKSFLLNLFIRYLRACGGTNESTDDWLRHDAEEELDGFPSKHTVESVTRGILIWPEIFKINEDIAVILMDTQGIFDDETSLQTDTYLFSLSLLLSSVQIFNIKGDLGRDNLKNLDIFTKIAHLVSGGSTNSTTTSPRPFQKLILLLRDWECGHEFGYGWKGGRDRLNKSRGGASASTLAAISKCFENELQCFLMPRPGDEIVENSSRKLSDMRRIFKDHVREFIENIFLPENLKQVKFDGKEITCGTFAGITKSCIREVGSGRYPIIRDIVSSVANDMITTLVDACAKEYEEEVSKLILKCPFEPADFNCHLHNKSNEVLEKFNSSPKIEIAEVTGKAPEMLMAKIDSLNKNFVSLNDKARRRRLIYGAAAGSGMGALVGSPASTPGIIAGVAVGGCIGGMAVILKSLPKVPAETLESADNPTRKLLPKESLSKKKV